jgi:hypothetical protein
MTRALLIALSTLALGMPAHAQEQPAEAPKAQQQPAPQQERREPNVVPRAAADSGQAVNIRLDVTITDQQAAGQPVVKTVTMVVADNWPSRIRTEGNVFTTGGQYPVGLNVDARPRLVGDKILLVMTVEYKPSAPDPKPGASATTLNQSFQVLLADGKPLVVTQSADPNTDRKVKLEVKATVLR